MLDIIKLGEAETILRKELSRVLRIHDQDLKSKDEWSRLCDIIGRLQVLSKVVKENTK